MDEGFEQIMSEASPKAAALARQARELIGAVYPPVVEVAWPRQQIIGYGVGPKKMSEQFSYIAVFKDRINLGFYYGSELPDPDGLLEGQGKLMRHIKIEQPADLENPALRTLLENASYHRMPGRTRE